MMKISLLGPTNMEKFSTLVGKPIDEVEVIAKDIGKILAQKKGQLVVVFNYSGMLKMVGDAYKEAGGEIEMLYTENNYDWETTRYRGNLKEAKIKTKKESWHDVLLSLVKEPDFVICAGLSAGVLAELGYMKWNYQENKGKVKALIGIKELLRGGEFPPELSFDMKEFIKILSVKELDQFL